MTIEKLLELPTDELGRLTSDDAELTTFLAPHFPSTRPAKRAANLVAMTNATGDMALALSGKLHVKPVTSGLDLD